MNEYLVRLDAGMQGETIVKAENVEKAWQKAQRWMYRRTPYLVDTLVVEVCPKRGSSEKGKAEIFDWRTGHHEPW